MKQTIDPKIPLLMYHEVSDHSVDNRSGYSKTTPLYDITSDLFESHLQLLEKKGFRSILFEDVHKIKDNKKNVILTFDDGFSGNYRYALPLLQKYGFSAVFFIRVGTIGSETYMTWDQLQELIECGMSVQSHTISHRPLQTLTLQEVRTELRGSKSALEKVLKNEVDAISFPHGSFKPEALQVANDEGYRFICTSEIQKTFLTSFIDTPAVLGRIPVTTKLSTKRLAKCLEYDALEFCLMWGAKEAKNIVKRTIGINAYRKIYRKLFKIQKPAV